MSGPLNHSPAEIVSRVLIAMGKVSEPPATSSTSWPVFITHEPDKPDNCVTLFNTTGRKRGRIMLDGESQLWRGIQIRIRAVTAALGYAKADLLYDAIDKGIYQKYVTISGTEYLLHSLTTVGDIIDIGYETPVSKRNVHTINALARVLIRPT